MTQLGIQLIVFGKRGGEDLPGVLRDVKAAGYDGAEIGVPLDTPAETIRGYFDDAGLSCAGYHSGYALFSDQDKLRKVADHMSTVGANFLMCSGVAGAGWAKATADDYKTSAEVFNAAGALLEAHGIDLCYHNHNWEFFDLGGGDRGIDLLATYTDPAVVKFCTDVFWVACGGDNPAEFIQKHIDRAVYFHLKDGSFDAKTQQPSGFTELGNGQVDLASAAEAIRSIAPEWVVTEQDKTERDPVESARISADYARKTLGF